MREKQLKGSNKIVNWSLMAFIMFWAALVVLCSLYMIIPLFLVFENEFSVKGIN